MSSMTRLWTSLPWFNLHLEYTNAREHPGLLQGNFGFIFADCSGMCTFYALLREENQPETYFSNIAWIWLYSQVFFSRQLAFCRWSILKQWTIKIICTKVKCGWHNECISFSWHKLPDLIIVLWFNIFWCIEVASWHSICVCSQSDCVPSFLKIETTACKVKYYLY